MALKTDPNTWPGAENWHTETLLYILASRQISSHDESPVKRYWSSKLPLQIYLQENTSESNKLGLDLARKTRQTGTWEDENWDNETLSWGQYEYAIWAHDESQDANGAQSKWATQNFATRNTDWKKIFVNGNDPEKYANGFVMSWNWAYLKYFQGRT